MLGRGLGQRGDAAHGRGAPRAIALRDGLPASGDGQRGLPHAGRAPADDVVHRRDAAAGGQLLPLLTIHRGLEANGATLTGLVRGEASHAGAHRDRLVLLGRALCGRQPIAAGRIGELLGTGLLQQGLPARLDPPELAVLEMCAQTQQLRMRYTISS